MPDARSDAELLNDTKLFGTCMYCGTPRMTNRNEQATVKREALICPNSQCPAMRAILAAPPD
jgi:hypothetical protein